MKTIFIILLVILAGFLFGMLLVRLFIAISNFFLKRKVIKDILRKDLKPEEIARRNFYFKDTFYNLAEMVEDDLKKHIVWYKRIFKKRQKGVSDYGTTGTTTSNGGTIPKPIREDRGNNLETNTDNSQQPSTNTDTTRGE